ncbi:MAG: phosphate acyltransferase PlsX [Clostridia bacterium]|nr:phosphate acyltransferase PlsX [Clostridia bacterium]
MKLIVDAFGGDNAPLAILKGCETAVRELGVEILLTGDEETIRNVAGENGISLEKMEICHTTQVVDMEDDPMCVVKTKKDSSIAVGLRLLNEGKGDAFVSAGSSGAIVSGGTLIVKRIRGVRRVAFAPIMPKAEGIFMLIDSGANNDCSPDMLRQFGIMGSTYMEKVMKIENPRVGLVNVGVEEHKGSETIREAYALLKESGLNFIGNVEAREIPADGADVIVADGFTGNVVLKLYEGVARELVKKIKGVFTKSLKNKLAAAMVLGDMKAFKKAMDYNEYGGAPLMGTRKPVFKAHGSSSDLTFFNALRLTKEYVESNAIEYIKEAIDALHEEE